MRVSALLLFTLFAVAGYSQNTLNNYKYVLVPLRFAFSEGDDQYGLNTTTKSLLEQKGFTVYWINKNVPTALATNRCSALVAEVIERKSFLSTNLTLELKDCQGNIVFKSKEGKSREKEFDVAYDQALRNAFATLNAAPYKYDSTLAIQMSTPAPAPSISPASPSKPAMTGTTATMTGVTGTLYAHAIPNGYQLSDTTPKIILTLLKTSIPDYFLTDTGTAAGIVFKKDSEWFLEYYKDDKLVSQKLKIKF